MYKIRLQQAGYKLTKPRTLVLDFLAKKHKPQAAASIYQNLKNKLDRVTVYRVLMVLEKVGLVFREQSGAEALYYLAEKQHHHIICSQCGYIQCVPCNHVFKKIKNFNQIKHQLVLTGLCKKCNN